MNAVVRHVRHRLENAWPRSLRVRLQIWYGSLLLAVVAAFGSLLYIRASREIDGRADAELEAALLVLDAELRAFPPHELGRQPPDLKDKFKPPPGKKRREDFLNSLDTPSDFASRGGYFAVWQEDGDLVKARGFAGEPWTAIDDMTLGAQPAFRRRGPIVEAWMAGPTGTKIVVGRSIARERRDLHAFGLGLMGLGLVVVAAGIAVGWLIASRLVRPIRRMSDVAARITGDDLSRRIDAAKVDAELAGLANVLNEMLSRLESAFDRQRQFAADASHELRTPIAIVRSQAELALSRSRTPEEYRQSLQACLGAAKRMTNLAGGLLAVARLDAGKNTSWQNVRLQETIADCVNQMRSLAEAKDVKLAATLVPVTIAGNTERISQLALNLIANAIAFNRPGGEVEVTLTADTTTATFAVRDTGQGIPAADLERIFERFYRADKSRSRAAGGAGLGLAICKAIVEAHHGTIDVESIEGAGSTFRVRLPLRQELSAFERSER